MMSYVIALLRLVHIVSAVTWVGMTLTLVVFVYPAISGESGYRFLKALYTRTQVGVLFPIVSLLTTICGVLLYLTGSGSHFSTLGNIVLGIGAVAGLSAFGHGAMALSGRTQRLTGQLQASLPDGAPADAQKISALDTSTADYLRQARITLIMSAVALLGMGLARYL